MTEETEAPRKGPSAGLQAFWAEFGALTYALHEHRARVADLETQNARLKDLLRQIGEQGGHIVTRDEDQE